MAGLDRFTEFRVVNVPVGAGVVVEGGQALGALVAALGTKLLGTTVGAYGTALAQLLAAWALRRPAIDRFVGVATADLVAAVWSGMAIDSVLGLQATVKGLLNSIVGTTLGVTLSQGPTAPAARAAVRPAAVAVPQFRSAVHQKAALTRL